MPTKSEERDLVTVDRKVLREVIAEIEENLEILESLAGEDILQEAERRVQELREGKVTPLDEKELLDLLERD
jgi:hypothetical protein